MARPTEQALVSDQAAERLDPSGFDPSREIFGIECEHHYGITTHPMPADGDVIAEAYRLLRMWHHWLDDDNHTWSVRQAENPDWFSSINVTKNEHSPLFAWRPNWVDDGPGAHWFSQKFRVATRGMIEREIASRIVQAERCEANAAKQRDTVRGRKARAKDKSIATTARREAELIRSRWPEFDGSPRTEWQERMHCHRDSDRSPTGGDGEAGSVHEGAARRDRPTPSRSTIAGE